MKKAVKILLITAVSLIVIGAAAFCIVMTANGWDFSKLGSGKMETNTYEVSEDVRAISIRSETEDIIFCPSADGKCSVVCYENEKAKHVVKVQDGTLAISINDTRAWYDYIALFNIGSPTITVYLPETEYESLFIEESTGEITVPKDFAFGSIKLTVSTGDVDCRASSEGLLSIHTSTGDISLADLSAGELDLSVSTGRVELQSITCDGTVGLSVSTGKADFTDVSCEKLSSTGSTGDLSLKNVIATDTISIDRSTGDISFDRCDAGELTVETDTGKVKGSLLSPKIFIVRSDTGRIDVPETTEGGKCKITTDTGNIQIEIAEE